MASRLTLDQRKKIKALMDEGISTVEIAETLGVHVATIYRELKRNTRNDGSYDPNFAQGEAKSRLKGLSPLAERNPELISFISKNIITEGLSPKEISKLTYSDDAGVHKVSVNTIYRMIDEGKIPGVTRETLRKQSTKMFSGGLLMVPTWVRKQFNFDDGDEFEIDVSVVNQITFRKINNME